MTRKHILLLLLITMLGVSALTRSTRKWIASILIATWIYIIS